MHQAKQQQPTRVVLHEHTINLPLRMRARDVTPAKDALPGYLRPTRSQILKSQGRLTTDEASASDSTGASPWKALYTPRTRYSHSPQSSRHSFVTAREEQDSASDSGSVVHVDSRTVRARRTDRPLLTVNVPDNEPTASPHSGKRDWIAPLQCSPAIDSPKSPSSPPKRVIRKRQTLPNLRSTASEPIELPAHSEAPTVRRLALPRLVAPSKEAREKTEERAARTGEHFDSLTKTEERRLASIHLRMKLKGAGGKVIIKEASTEGDALTKLSAGGNVLTACSPQTPISTPQLGSRSLSLQYLRAGSRHPSFRHFAESLYHLIRTGPPTESLTTRPISRSSSMS